MRNSIYEVFPNGTSHRIYSCRAIRFEPAVTRQRDYEPDASVRRETGVGQQTERLSSVECASCWRQLALLGICIRFWASALSSGAVVIRLLLLQANHIVHQGGIGTCAQTLRAGCPSLVVPFGFDQSSRFQPRRAHLAARWKFLFGNCCFVCVSRSNRSFSSRGRALGDLLIKICSLFDI
jgi:hypothetical protein